jgi:hypothetical protein
VYANYGGQVEVMSAGSYFQSEFDLTNSINYSSTITLECGDLPAAILLHGGPAGGTVYMDINTAHPPLAFYFPYDGELTINPSIPATKIGTEKGFNNPYADLLVRIPFAY